MDQLFLFTGENGFALRQELLRWIREFRTKHGEENLSRVDAARIGWAAFLTEISAAPFIAERRLIVVDGVPSFGKSGDDAPEPSPGLSPSPRLRGTSRPASKATGNLRALLEQAHPQVLLLFVAPRLDRRLTATKELLSLATVREFPPLTGEALLRWMQAMLRELNAMAETTVLEHLLETVGEDQMSLSQELQKLALYAQGRPITCADVSLLALPSAERTVWRLMDMLGEGRTQEAVSYVGELMQRGESAQGIWSILLWILSSLMQVVAALEKGTTSLQAIVSETGVKFNAARSLLPLARKCRSERLRPLLDRVVAADIGLKTGALSAGADPEEEVAAAVLERCLLAFPTG